MKDKQRNNGNIPCGVGDFKRAFIFTSITYTFISNVMDALLLNLSITPSYLHLIGMVTLSNNIII